MIKALDDIDDNLRTTEDFTLWVQISAPETD
jgi:hypothetical protein